VELNKVGFVIKNSSGVEVFSTHSALSGVQVGSGAITVPVPDVPELYYRLDAGEGRLTDAQRADVEQRAKDWYAAHQPSNASGTPDPVYAADNPVMKRSRNFTAATPTWETPPTEAEKKSED